MPDPAVLLLAYGTPASLEDVPAYFTHIRHGRTPTRKEIADLTERYRQIGGRSPLLSITRQQAEAVETELRRAGISMRSYVGMRHWHPFIADTVRTLAANSHSELVALPLAPFYSRLSIGAYEEAVRSALHQHAPTLPLTFIDQWHTRPLFLQTWRELISTAFQALPAPDPRETHVVFTAHSLPESTVGDNDPYPSQFQATAGTLAAQLNLSHWSAAYQSAGMAGGRWLGPDILQILGELRQSGVRQTLVAPIGFVADHLEILYDIDIELQRQASREGILLRRTSAPNTHPTFIQALADLITGSLATHPEPDYTGN